MARITVNGMSIGAGGRKLAPLALSQKAVAF
jgi:hypothetical protein